MKDVLLQNAVKFLNIHSIFITTNLVYAWAKMDIFRSNYSVEDRLK